MKIKVTKEEFKANFCPGFCPMCEHYIEETESCEIEEEARYETRNFAKEYDYDEDDAKKMDCVMWEYKYTTE